MQSFVCGFKNEGTRGLQQADKTDVVKLPTEQHLFLKSGQLCTRKLLQLIWISAARLGRTQEQGGAIEMLYMQR